MCGGGRSCLPVLHAHALNTSADAYLDHAGLDGMSDINTGLETRRALSVQGLDGSTDGEASSQSGGTELSGATSGRQDRADSDIFDEARVDLGSINERLEGTDEQVCGRGVLKSSLTTLCERCSQSSGHDNLRITRQQPPSPMVNLQRGEGILTSSGFFWSSAARPPFFDPEMWPET
jgi:hypothetical protein